MGKSDNRAIYIRGHTLATDATTAERRMIMKCRECPDYAKCVKESNLKIKRKSCKKAKTKYVMKNADHFRAMSDEEQQNFVRKFWEIEDFADWLKQPFDGELLWQNVQELDAK